jgi:hypothetical protein
MSSIIEKLHIITEVLDLSSEHIPEGKYLEAMNSIRDVCNHIINGNERSIRIIDRLHAEIINETQTSWWKQTCKLTNGQIAGYYMLGTIAGLICHEVIHRIIKK